jgi:RimJ/RimL family protein N-acetyltransferase
MIIVETPRLVLRPWQPNDGDAYAAMFADPEVSRYVFLRGAPQREQIAELSDGYVRQWQANGFGPFAAIDKTTGAWIGQIGLNHLAWWPERDKVEVGWELGRAWWGRGLASEGGTAALRYGFRQRGLSRIISVTVAGNEASRRVMTKVGLRYQGVKTISGTDVVWYAADNPAPPPDARR